MININLLIDGKESSGPLPYQMEAAVAIGLNRELILHLTFQSKNMSMLTCWMMDFLWIQMM